MRKLYFILALIVCTNPISISEPVQAQTAPTTSEDNVKLIDGLRRRRLFELAESFCAESLADPNIGATEQATLTIELIKTLTSKAVLTQTEGRQQNWQAVEKTIADFRTAYPDHPRAFLVEVQRALSHISNGQLLRQELDADMTDGSARDKAIEELKSARSLLETIQRDITKTIPKNRGRKLNDDELSSEQLLTLKKNIRYQLAICNLNRSQLYDTNDPANQLNRMDALNTVIADLSEVQRETSPEDSLWWNSKVAQLEGLRLLEKNREALALLDSLPPEDVPGSSVQALLEQRLLLAIETNDSTFSQAALGQAMKLAERSPKVDLAIVSLASQMALLAQDDEQKQKWLDFAAQQTRKIEQAHGGYWGRRAELVLIATAGGSVNDNRPKTTDTLVANGNPKSMSTTETKNSGKLDLLIRLGDQAFRKGRFDDAIKAYDQAFNVAVDESNATEAVRTQVKASQVLEEQKQHGLAAQRLIEVSKNYPTQSLSASAHLRGCWNFAQTISPESRNTRTQFIAFLREHLALWTKAATADQARIYLGSQLESEKDWRFAFEQYLDVSEQKISDVTSSIRRCSNNYLTEQSRTQNSTKSLASKIIEQIETKRVTLGNNKDAADQLLMTQIEIDLLYETCRPNPSYTSRLNSIVLSSINKVRVNALRAISISLSNPNEALTLIGKLGSEAADLVELSRCDAYVRSMIKKGSLNDRETQTAHTLRLALIQRSLEILDQQPQSDQKRTTRWMVKKSEALVALNQNSEALLVLQDLKKTLPKSATIQMQLARTMTTIYRDKDPKKALNQWRLVAARLKSHTSNWYEAKYFVALLLIESGEKKEANKLLRYIQAIPPGWENSTRKREFETLLKSSR